MRIRTLVFALLLGALNPLSAEARDPNAGYRIGVLTELSQKSVENRRTVLAKRAYNEPALRLPRDREALA